MMAAEEIKDLPGYKAILKAVLQQQIQMLVEQLNEQTGEETVVISASVTEGTLSHFGSEYAKTFLEQEHTIKSKFLGFCLRKNLRYDDTLKETTSYKKKRKSTALSEPDFSNLALKVPKLRNEDTGQNSTAAQQNMVGNLPDIRRATSDYLMKLNETVGQEVMRNDLPGTSLEEGHFPVLQSSGNDNNRHGLDASYDLDMSIVKVESEDENSYTEGITDKEAYGSVKMTQGFSDLSYQGNANTGLKLNDSDLNPGYSKHLEQYRNWSANFGTNFVPSNGEIGVDGQSIPRQYRTFKCEFCDKEFREKTNLRVHVRTHTGEKPFKCFLCGKDFAHSSNLKQHERGVHKLPPTVPQYKQQFYTGLSKMAGLSQEVDGVSIDNQQQMFLGNQSHSQSLTDTANLSSEGQIVIDDGKVEQEERLVCSNESVDDAKENTYIPIEAKKKNT